MNANTKPTSYVPFDELLEQPIIKLLRLLSRLGWIDKLELREALDLPPMDRGAPGRASERITNQHNAALIRLVKAGHVERADRRYLDHRCIVRTSNVYRITSSGRDELARRMRHAQIDAIATDEELDEVDDAPICRRRRRSA